MAGERTVYHVVPNADQSRWVVSRERHSFREEYDSKDEAVEAAKSRARSEEPSQVKVHKLDGNMEYESTYGDDPSRSPG
jgi:sugar-specific transcriptional regulator TrmB